MCFIFRLTNGKQMKSNKKYNKILAVASCMLGMTYVWLIPYITDFSSPFKRKLTSKYFNNSDVFSHYSLNHNKLTDEYTVFIKTRNAHSDAMDCYVSSAYDRLHFLFVNVTFSLQFSLLRAPYTAVKISCMDEQEFIFHSKHTSTVFPLIAKDKHTFLSPKYYASVFDILSYLTYILYESFDNNDKFSHFRVFVRKSNDSVGLVDQQWIH